MIAYYKTDKCVDRENILLYRAAESCRLLKDSAQGSDGLALEQSAERRYIDCIVSSRFERVSRRYNGAASSEGLLSQRGYSYTNWSGTTEVKAFVSDISVRRRGLFCFNDVESRSNRVDKMFCNKPLNTGGNHYENCVFNAGMS